jgi:hypothetical protein
MMIIRLPALRVWSKRGLLLDVSMQIVPGNTSRRRSWSYDPGWAKASQRLGTPSLTGSFGPGRFQTQSLTNSIFHLFFLLLLLAAVQKVPEVFFPPRC